MKILTIFALVLLALPLLGAVSSTTETEFTVSNSSNLGLNIISPRNITYSTHLIPIEVATSLASTCSYKLNQGSFVLLGTNSTHFASQLNLENGAYTILFKCETPSQGIQDSVSFSVRHISCKTAKKETFSSLPVICYDIYNCTSWTCKDGFLTRTCQFNTCEDSFIQRGDSCDNPIQLLNSPKTSTPTYYNLILILAILILFVIILLVFALRR